MGITIKIADLPLNERPRERLIRYGSETLSNSELLAIILRTGIKEASVLDLCNSILKSVGGLNGLMNLSSQELMAVKGIGTAKAAQLIALSELCKRFKSYKSGDDYRITKPQDAAELVMEEMKSFREEHLRVIMLNTKNLVTYIKDVSVGSINSSIVHPREIFCEAIKRRSASIIICHNHPSGDPSPSCEDINVTNRLKECSKLIGIDLLDHIIIGNGIYISLKEKGIL